ncbi:DUF4198 domain-containing protein [Tuwongella immobilis]|uniref:Carboxypeptidase regulatory-like domain-containing protein n=1 Tax=Tuwongella immobilis TaxID=692036 RepID=A0A6C2YKW4_9BACT|nr:DUF4198 domain-containing protein [Tuwongella immobilis]VIP01745.1 Putative secreted protein OS=Rhodopirellula sp. SWK7 GN=RRSWK_05138 PE=4 SV=1 [Tuwongella immobilis]VTR99323.1 Putative secreted protein OS=Rhodopirellula sp. SWK7 GN=RRSWK_05138 PE=4 SV=1 [Tuwongella immobilis]
MLSQRILNGGMLTLLMGLSLGMTGCGDPYKLVPAQGVVQIDGKPAGNITVQLMPDSLRGAEGPTSFGTTDATGKFTLRTYDGRDGAVIGPHLVTLVDNDEERPAQGKAPTRAPRLASRFAIPSPKGISVEVKEGGEPLTITASAR